METESDTLYPNKEYLLQTHVRELEIAETLHNFSEYNHITSLNYSQNIKSIIEFLTQQPLIKEAVSCALEEDNVELLKETAKIVLFDLAYTLNCDIKYADDLLVDYFSLN